MFWLPLLLSVEILTQYSIQIYSTVGNIAIHMDFFNNLKMFAAQCRGELGIFLFSFSRTLQFGYIEFLHLEECLRYSHELLLVIGFHHFVHFGRHNLP
jgi:hypothetical protein